MRLPQSFYIYLGKAGEEASFLLPRPTIIEISIALRSLNHSPDLLDGLLPLLGLEAVTGTGDDVQTGVLVGLGTFHRGVVSGIGFIIFE